MCTAVLVTSRGYRNVSHTGCKQLPLCGKLHVGPVWHVKQNNDISIFMTFLRVFKYRECLKILLLEYDRTILRTILLLIFFWSNNSCYCWPIGASKNKFWSQKLITRATLSFIQISFSGWYEHFQICGCFTCSWLCRYNVFALKTACCSWKQEPKQ